MDIHFKEAILFAENLVSHVMNRLYYRNTPYRNVDVFPRAEEYRESSVYNGFSDNVRKAVDFLLHTQACSIESRFDDIVENGDLSQEFLRNYSVILWKRYFSEGVEVITFLRFCVTMAGIAVHFYRRGLTWAPDLAASVIVDRLPIMGPCRITWDTIQALVDRFVEEKINLRSPREGEYDSEQIPSTSAETTSCADLSSCACFQGEIIGRTFWEIYEGRNNVLYKHRVNCCGGGVDIERPGPLNCSPIKIRKFSSREEIESSEEFLKFTSQVVNEIWNRLGEIKRNECFTSSASTSSDAQPEQSDLSDEIRDSGRKVTKETDSPDSKSAWSQGEILQWMESGTNTDESGHLGASSADNVQNLGNAEQLSGMPISEQIMPFSSKTEEEPSLHCVLLTVYKEYSETRYRLWLNEIKRFFTSYKAPLHVDVCSNEPPPTKSDLQFPEMSDFLNRLVRNNNSSTTSYDWRFQPLPSTSNAGPQSSSIPMPKYRQIERPLKIYLNGKPPADDFEIISSEAPVKEEVHSHSNKLDAIPLEKQFMENLSESFGNKPLDAGSSSSLQEALTFPTDLVAASYLQNILKENQTSNLAEYLSNIVDGEKKPGDFDNSSSSDATSQNPSLPSREDQLEYFPLGRRSEILSSEISGKIELDTGSSSASCHALPEYIPSSPDREQFLEDDPNSSDPLEGLSDIEDGFSSSDNSEKYPELQWTKSSSDSEPSPDLGK